MQVTDEWLKRCRTASGGYTAEQLRMLGVAWPPRRGWKRQVIGRRLDDRTVERFEAIGKGVSR